MFLLRPLLAVLMAYLLLADISPAFPQARRPKTTEQNKAKGTRAEKPSAEPLVYTPGSSDDIACTREWHDVSGEHSVKARLRSFEASTTGAGAVVLEKDDRTAVRVSVQNLSKEDQSLVTSFALASSKSTIAEAVKTFLDLDLGDTDARIEENVKTAAQKLCSKSNGRVFQLRFPIQNVTETESKGTYRLKLAAPKLPDTSGWRYISSADMKLTKQEALKIGSSSVLVVTGRVQLSASGSDQRAPMVALFDFLKDRPSAERKAARVAASWIIWTRTTTTSTNKNYVREVTLVLLDQKMKVVNGEAEAKTPEENP